MFVFSTDIKKVNNLCFHVIHDFFLSESQVIYL